MASARTCSPWASCSWSSAAASQRLMSVLLRSSPCAARAAPRQLTLRNAARTSQPSRSCYVGRRRSVGRRQRKQWRGSIASSAAVVAVAAAPLLVREMGGRSAGAGAEVLKKAEKGTNRMSREALASVRSWPPRPELWKNRCGVVWYRVCMCMWAFCDFVRRSPWKHQVPRRSHRRDGISRNHCLHFQ